jgi:hypothetical protein
VDFAAAQNKGVWQTLVQIDVSVYASSDRAHSVSSRNAKENQSDAALV